MALLPAKADSANRRRPVTTRGWVYGLSIWLALGPVAAWAQQEAPAAPRGQVAPEVLQQAKRHYDKGAALYEVGKYEAAHVEFREAYRISHLPDLLFNLSRTSEMLNKPSAAIEYLELYLQENPKAPDRAQIQSDIARLHKLEGQSPTAPDRPDQAVGPTQPVPQPPQQVPPPQARPASKRPEWLPPWPQLTLMGGGAAFLIIGASLGGAALSDAGQVQKGNADGTFNKGLDQQGRSLNAAAITFDVLGALALGGGVGWSAWWYIHRKHAPPVQAVVVPTGSGVLFSGSF